MLPRQHPGILIALLAALSLTGGIERFLGRSWLGPDGQFGLWEGSIWSRESSQRLADPYSFSHVAHGILFYALLFLGLRRVPVRFRFLAAVALEAGWEILENSPIIINRYRQVTIALGYDGDSILNSMSDVLMMSLGFLLAWRLPVRATVCLLIAMEVGCALWVRDNLTLNVVMLLHPIEAIRAWQTAGQPALP